MRAAGLTYLAVLAYFGALQIFGDRSWLWPITSIAAAFTAMFIHNNACTREHEARVDGRYSR